MTDAERIHHLEGYCKDADRSLGLMAITIEKLESDLKRSEQRVAVLQRALDLALSKPCPKCEPEIQ